MVKVVVGSIVLCHLLSGTPNINQNQEESNIIKVLGKVIDIQKGSRYLEKVEERQALRVDKHTLIIKGQNIEGMYQVDSRACMLVRDETPEERENRLFPKISEEDAQKEDEEGKKPVILSEKIIFEESHKDLGIEIQDKPTIEDSFIESKIESLPIKENTPLPEPDPIVQEVKPKVKKEEIKKEVVKEEKNEIKEEDEKTPVKEKNRSLLDYIR